MFQQTDVCPAPVSFWSKQQYTLQMWVSICLKTDVMFQLQYFWVHKREIWTRIRCQHSTDNFLSYLRRYKESAATKSYRFLKRKIETNSPSLPIHFINVFLSWCQKIQWERRGLQSIQATKNKKERTRKAGSALYGQNHLHMMRSLSKPMISTHCGLWGVSCTASHHDLQGMFNNLFCSYYFICTDSSCSLHDIFLSCRFNLSSCTCKSWLTS